MKVSITIEAQLGLDWPLWKRLVPRLEELGFATVFRSDHFPSGSPPVTDALELITSLTYLAGSTSRVHFGSLVAPLSVRDPVMLARQAMAINDLSGGRMVLGVGAGHQEEEHTQFGYTLGDTSTRLDRLAEALEVITRLVRRAEPVSFQGRFYRLEQACLLPRPQHPLRILVGGNGPKRMLPLAARYADAWNCQGETPAGFRRLSARLDELLAAQDRAPGSVKRTVMNPVICFRTPEELQKKFDLSRQVAIFANASDAELLGLFASMNPILGSPAEVIQKMQEYAAAGVDEFIIQWFLVNDLEGMQTIASEILPQFHGL